MLVCSMQLPVEQCPPLQPQIFTLESLRAALPSYNCKLRTPMGAKISNGIVNATGQVALLSRIRVMRPSTQAEVASGMKLE